jgi:response regulator RpfG family c-di-GMP phosphodiesterase
MELLKTIDVARLKEGMFVVLPVSWFNHPFLKNRFVITGQQEIDRIMESGLEKVEIDLARGADDEDEGPVAEVASSQKTWDPESLIPAALREALHDKGLDPGKRAEVVYQSSREMMQRLLADPKAENIAEAKKGISEVVDLIIADNETSENLLRITTHDVYTYTHSVNVGVYSVMLAGKYFKGSDAHDMHELGAGFFLHDIGKVRIPQTIINKPGGLTRTELQVMRTHPYQGFQLLAEASHLSEECRAIVMEHHERVDGKGYPLGLKGEAIHIYGRICSVADVYDALTSERSYKSKLTTFKALRMMKHEMLGHFHEDLFESFVRLFSGNP